MTFARQPDPRERFTRLPEGTTIRSLEWGTGRRPCVMLHGLADTADTWRPVASHLGGLVRTVALDLPGHGKSDAWSPDRYTLDHYVDAATSIIGALHLRRPALIGHSLGGEIALRIASLGTLEIGHLILVDYNPWLSHMAGGSIGEELATRLRHYHSQEDYVSSMADRMPNVSVCDLRAVAPHLLRPVEPDGYLPRVDVGVLTLLRGTREDNAVERSRDLANINRVGTPTTIIRGKFSAVLSEGDATAMLEALGSRASLRAIGGAGHAISLEQPDSLARVIRETLLDDSRPD